MERGTFSSKHHQLATRLIWLLVLGFVWLQLLGTAHRYLHATPPASRTVNNAAALTLGQSLLPDHSDSHLQQGSKACQLFDLACADLAISPATASLPTQAPVTLVACANTRCAPNYAFLAFEARGPPAFI